MISALSHVSITVILVNNFAIFFKQWKTHKYLPKLLRVYSQVAIYSIKGCIVRSLTFAYRINGKSLHGYTDSGKLWQALNLVNQSSECIGKFLIWRSRAFPHRATVCEIILAGFKFGDFPQNCQLARLKTSPKFSAIRYMFYTSQFRTKLTSKNTRQYHYVIM